MKFVCLKYTTFVHTQELERSNNAIEKLFTPLNHHIYGNGVLILKDCPSYQTKGGVEYFVLRYN